MKVAKYYKWIMRGYLPENEIIIKVFAILMIVVAFLVLFTGSNSNFVSAPFIKNE